MPFKMFHVAFVFLCVLGLSFHATATVLPKEAARVKCRSALGKLLKQLEPAGEWDRQVDPLPGAVQYRSPTSVFSRWLELDITAQGEAFLRVIQADKTFVYSLVAPKCQAQRRNLKRARPLQGRKVFTDWDLKKLLKSGRPGLIYIWSPTMTYSMKFYNRYKKIAQQAGLDFIALMDPRISKQRAERAVHRRGIPLHDRRVDSVELLMRNTTTHFPTTVVYANGRLDDEILVGVLNETSLKRRILSRIIELRGDRGVASK